MNLNFPIHSTLYNSRTGIFKIQVSYDFDGNIFEEDDKEMSGTIYFRNFNINITTDRSVCQEITDEGTPIREIYYKPLRLHQWT